MGKLSLGHIWKKEKGQALVEFALILPLLVFLLLGIVEYGRVFNAGLAVAHSAREGARVAVTGASDSTIIARAVNSAAGLEAARLQVTVTPAQADRGRGQEVIVRVSYPVSVVAPFISIFTGETVTVRSASAMRME